MPIKYILDNNIIVYEISEALNFETIEILSHKILDEIIPDTSYLELYLIKENAAYLSVKNGYYEKFRNLIFAQNEIRNFPTDKAAIVTFDAYSRKVMPLWRSIVSMRPDYRGETEIFDNIEIAADWLGVQLEDVQNMIEKIKVEKSY